MYDVSKNKVVRGLLYPLSFGRTGIQSDQIFIFKTKGFTFATEQKNHFN